MPQVLCAVQPRITSNWPGGCDGVLLLPYPIFLMKSTKCPNRLKNSEKPHFNPLRIEKSCAFVRLGGNSCGILALNLQMC